MKLVPEDFPIALPRELEEFIPPEAGSLIEATRRLARLREMENTDEREWLVSNGPLAGPLMTAMEEVCAAGHESREPRKATYATYLAGQVCLSRLYGRTGLRDGLCAPWRVTERLNWYSYKVHAALATRNDKEPFKLDLGQPICKCYVGKEGDLAEGEEMTCRGCFRMMTFFPHLVLCKPAPISQDWVKQ